MKQSLLIVALAALGGSVWPAQHPDLSGHWVFNKGQSDNPRDMMARDSGNGGGGGGGGGRMGGGGRGGRAGGQGGEGGGMSDEQRARMRQTMDLVLSAPSSLEITA